VLAAAGALDVQHGRDLHRQAEQLDEALGILLIVDIFLAEGGVILAVEAEGRLAADDG